MKLNFGKYSGVEIDEVAIVDPMYATWAANNLKNVTLRKAFADAIIAAKSATVEQKIEAEVGSDAPEHIKQMVRDDHEAERQSKARKAEIINRYAKVFGIAPKDLCEKARDMFNRPIERRFFSSEEKFNQFNQMMEEIYNV
jgi:hypothetical protein